MFFFEFESGKDKYETALLVRLIRENAGSCLRCVPGLTATIAFLGGSHTCAISRALREDFSRRDDSFNVSDTLVLLAAKLENCQHLVVIIYPNGRKVQLVGANKPRELDSLWNRLRAYEDSAREVKEELDIIQGG